LLLPVPVAQAVLSDLGNLEIQGLPVVLDYHWFLDFQSPLLCPVNLLLRLVQAIPWLQLNLCHQYLLPIQLLPVGQ